MLRLKSTVIRRQGILFHSWFKHNFYVLLMISTIKLQNEVISTANGNTGSVMSYISRVPSKVPGSDDAECNDWINALSEQDVFLEDSGDIYLEFH
jgi:hypothetical protein